jgi:hypothetical protein
VDLHWWSIEVRHGDFSAGLWRDAHGEALTEAAITHGIRHWQWIELHWGIVFEVGFAEPEAWARPSVSCRRSGRPWTPCPTASTVSTSTPVAAAARAPAARAARVPRSVPARRRCPGSRSRSSSPAVRRPSGGPRWLRRPSQAGPVLAVILVATS